MNLKTLIDDHVTFHAVDHVKQITEDYVLVPKGWVEVAVCPIQDCVDGAH